MTLAQKIEAAALNNAVWCDTICRTHGCPGEFQEDLWVNAGRVPPFYPNAVTLRRAGQTAERRERIRELVQGVVPPGATVKDSFHSLELASRGFALLFNAQWIYRPLEMLVPKVRLSRVRWEAITAVPALAAWEAARGGEQDGPAIFLPALLADKNVVVMAAYRGSQIVAGAVANRTDTAAGISNIFTPGRDADEFRSACVTQAMAAFPGLPLVGYERGVELTAMQAIGFEAVGPLTVWQRISVA